MPASLQVLCEVVGQLEEAIMVLLVLILLQTSISSDSNFLHRLVSEYRLILGQLNKYLFHSTKSFFFLDLDNLTAAEAGAALHVG